MKSVPLLKLLKFTTWAERLAFLVSWPLVTTSGIGLFVSFTISDYMNKHVELVYKGEKSFGQVSKKLLNLIILSIFSMIGLSVMGYLGMSYIMVLGEKMVYRMRKAYFKRALHMDMSQLDDLGAGEITCRIGSDMDIFREGVVERLPSYLLDSGLFAASVLGCLSLNRTLGQYVIAPIIASYLALMLANYISEKLLAKALLQYALAASLSEEVFSSVRTVHSFNSNSKLSQIYTKFLQEGERLTRQRILAEGFAVVVLTFSVYLGVAIDFKLGFEMLAKGEISSEPILGNFCFLFLALFSLQSVLPNELAMTNARAAAAKIFQVTDSKPTIHGTIHGTIPGKGEVLSSSVGSLGGQIKFEGIHFSYPSRPDVKIFKGFCLEVEAGTTVALVGESGSGKSTLIQLLERFYDPDQGQVTIDGQDIRKFEVKWLRQQMGLVSQEPILFSGTIAENVALGSTVELSMKEIEEACKKANAHEFITQLPEGYATQVGERGFLLSGGQKQRIAIARAIVRNPNLLLLDEATSALDSKSEKLVQEALDKASQGRTTIVIAHRLSTIKNADKIVVLEKGSIIEQGSHQELMALGGAYFNLAKTQTSCPVVPIQQISSVDGSANKEMVTSRLQIEDDMVKYGFLDIFKMNLGYNLIGGIGAVVLGLMFFILFLSFGNSFENFSLLFLVAILAGVVQAACLFGFGIGATKLSTSLRLNLFKSILDQEPGWFDSNPVGLLVGTSSLIPHRVAIFTGTAVGSFISSLVNILTTACIGFYLDWRVTSFMLTFFPICIGLGLWSTYTTDMYKAQSKLASQESMVVACENTAQMRTVASLTKEDSAFLDYQTKLKKSLSIGYRNAFFSSIGTILSNGITPLVVAGAWLFMAYLKQDSDTSLALGEMFTVVALFILTATDVTRKLPLITCIRPAKESINSFFQITTRQPRIDFSPDGPGKCISSELNALEFKQVHFSYPSRLDRRSLNGISFKVQKGQFVALVGPSGCGKSTCINLIERFYDVTQGSISLDGSDIRDLHLPTYRDHISLVGQEPALFNLSIKDNILLGARTYASTPTMEDVINAAKSANIHDFIISLPDAYETLVGGKGTHLSGGQKQRIAIARALIRNPQILLLDEATSALDADSERVVQAALDLAAHGRTTIAIAHRLSTIQNAHLILVMKDGDIVERGTHQELVSLGGLYSEMVAQQSLA